MNPKFHAIKIKDIQRETAQAVSIGLEIPENLKDEYRYKPGQHLTFEKEIEGEKVRRSYSVCTGLQEGELRVAVKKMPYGKFSTFANEVLKAGDVVDIMTPLGEFTIDFDKDTEKNFVFFAAGSGITPIMSLIKSILPIAPKSNITLIYGNRGFEHIIFREELNRIKNEYMNNFSLMHVFSDEKIGNKLQDGLLNYEQVQRIYDLKLKQEGVDDVFVCGPHPCIMAVKDVFTEAGFEKHQIHFELFTSPDDDKKKSAKKPVREQVDANLKVILDEEEIKLNLASNGDSILDAAIKGGMDAPYSCKGGVCSTCRAKVIKGKVEMDKCFALEDDEIEEGYILTCQAHPVSDEVIVSYDE